MQIAIREEAEELLSEKRVISGAINIRTNKEKMKARVAPCCPWCTPFITATPATFDCLQQLNVRPFYPAEAPCIAGMWPVNRAS